MNFWTFGLSSLDLTISASVATALSKLTMRESIQRSRISSTVDMEAQEGQHTGSSIRSQQTALGLKCLVKSEQPWDI